MDPGQAYHILNKHCQEQMPAYLALKEALQTYVDAEAEIGKSMARKADYEAAEQAAKLKAAQADDDAAKHEGQKQERMGKVEVEVEAYRQDLLAKHKKLNKDVDALTVEHEAKKAGYAKMVIEREEQIKNLDGVLLAQGKALDELKADFEQLAARFK